jgi:hypothetical protein
VVLFRVFLIAKGVNPIHVSFHERGQPNTLHVSFHSINRFVPLRQPT